MGGQCRPQNCFPHPFAHFIGARDWLTLKGTIDRHAFNPAANGLIYFLSNVQVAPVIAQNAGVGILVEAVNYLTSPAPLDAWVA